MRWFLALAAISGLAADFGFLPPSPMVIKSESADVRVPTEPAVNGLPAVSGVRDDPADSARRSGSFFTARPTERCAAMVTVASHLEPNHSQEFLECVVYKSMDVGGSTTTTHPPAASALFVRVYSQMCRGNC